MLVIQARDHLDTFTPSWECQIDPAVWDNRVPAQALYKHLSGNPTVEVLKITVFVLQMKSLQGQSGELQKQFEAH